MGFTVQIETGSEILTNWHPQGDRRDGKAVFAFLCGLESFCTLSTSNDGSSLQEMYAWYRQLAQLCTKDLCIGCKSLLACMWGDRGDSTQYGEDDYEFYLSRHSYNTSLTKDEYRKILTSNWETYQPIHEVIECVQFLLEVIRNPSLIPLEGFFDPIDTIPDFEALLHNLLLLEQRGNEEVRLNFR